MDSWYEKGFFVIRIKQINPDGFESKEPLMQKVSKGVSALLVWQRNIDAKIYIEKSMNEKEKCFITKETMAFYYNIRDRYQKINEQLVLKVIE